MWIASLSNGETVKEYDTIKETRVSSWQSLLKWLRENKVTMTQIRLQRNGVTLVGAPNADGYVQCRKIVKSVNTKREENYQGIGSIFGEQVFMTWLNDSGTVKHEVVPLSEMLIHSTLQ